MLVGDRLGPDGIVLANTSGTICVTTVPNMSHASRRPSDKGCQPRRADAALSAAGKLLPAGASGSAGQAFSRNKQLSLRPHSQQSAMETPHPTMTMAALSMSSPRAGRTGRDAADA